MKLKNRDFNSPEVTEAVLNMIRRMTREELIAFLDYRDPGIEETDMTGRFPEVLQNKNKPQASEPQETPQS